MKKVDRDSYFGLTPPAGKEVNWLQTVPGKVETRIGTLEFFDGIPTKKTAALCYDNLDFLRGVETFLNTFTEQ